MKQILLTAITCSVMTRDLVPFAADVKDVSVILFVCCLNVSPCVVFSVIIGVQVYFVFSNRSNVI